MNPPKEVSLRRKLVSTARSITTRQVELEVGILRLTTNLYWLEPYNVKPLTADELAVVKAYHSQIADFSLGDERKYLAPELRQKEAEELAALNALYQPQLEKILRRIVAAA